MTKKGPALYAVLVECHRVNGMPRQRVVRHLGHIKEKYLWAPAHRNYFWECVDWALDDLAVPAETRETVEKKLLTTVKRPTEEELEELERFWKRYQASW
jgi:hypothetical protein